MSPLVFLAFFSQAIHPIKPAFATAPVSTDADDPAIWVNPAHPERSLIYGTDKSKAPEGGLYAFDLEGKVVQHIGGLDRPNNIDVEYGLKMGSETADIAVATERLKNRLLIYRIDPQDGKLVDVTGNTRVFEGETGEDAAPMGIGMYRRPKDGEVFAVVTPKGGKLDNHVAQYRLVYNPETKHVDLKLARRFGVYSGKKETESVAVDDEKGIVYYSDETVGTHAYPADPDAPNAGKEIAFFNREGTKGDHEGIALLNDFVVCTDQIDENSLYRVFNKNSGGYPFIGAFSGGADATDGLDITTANLGPKFPKGIIVAMNSKGKNFFVYDVRDFLGIFSTK